MLAQTDVDILAGGVNLDPAVPPTSFLYGEMVDINHFLQQIAAMKPGDKMPAPPVDIRDYWKEDASIDFSRMKGARLFSVSSCASKAGFGGFASSKSTSAFTRAS